MAPARLYLDAAAGLPLRPEAEQALLGVLRTLHGNPGSPHAEGRAAKDALEEARTRVAASLGCRPREVVFTASGTEACNLGLVGTARARAGVGRRVVVGAVEHPCVLEAALALAAEGFEVLRVPVDAAGRIDPERFVASITPETAVAALMLANHETGNLFPVGEVAPRAAALGVPLLVDATLAMGRLPVSLPALGVPLLAFSGHKLGGPRGTGVLVVRRGTRVQPLLRGGMQEERLRPGTEDVAALAGLAAALEAAQRDQPAAAARLAALDSAFLAGLAGLPGWQRLGEAAAALPGLLTLEVEGVEGEAAMIHMDLAGVAVATGSTCALGGTEASPGLLAMGLSARRAAATLRISALPTQQEADLARAAAALCDAVERLRALARG
ncbi:MAG: cysteine desulfurase family protein [Planctomycetia bacterium]